jgi:hypothetical protein
MEHHGWIKHIILRSKNLLVSSDYPLDHNVDFYLIFLVESRNNGYKL